MTSLYTTPLGSIGRFKFVRLLPDITTMFVISCMPLVNGDAVRPSFAVLAPAPGAVKRSWYWSPFVSFGGIAPNW